MLLCSYWATSAAMLLPFFFLNFSYNFKILIKRKYFTIEPTITLIMSTIKPKSICMSIILMLSTITPKPNPNSLYSFNANPFYIPSFCSFKDSFKTSNLWLSKTDYLTSLITRTSRVQWDFFLGLVILFYSKKKKSLCLYFLYIIFILKI